jgi:hypothetical protein
MNVPKQLGVSCWSHSTVGCYEKAERKAARSRIARSVSYLFTDRSVHRAAARPVEFPQSRSERRAFLWVRIKSDFILTGIYLVCLSIKEPGTSLERGSDYKASHMTLVVLHIDGLLGNDA